MMHQKSRLYLARARSYPTRRPGPDETELKTEWDLWVSAGRRNVPDYGTTTDKVDHDPSRTEYLVRSTAPFPKQSDKREVC